MSSFADFAFSLRGLLVAVVAGALWLNARPASRGARRLLLTLVVFYLLASVYLVPYGISRILAAGFHELTPADVPSGTTAIILLGGGNVTVQGWRQERFAILGAVSAARTFEAFRVYRLLRERGAWIVSSGGAARSEDLHQSNAALMRDALVQLGVPQSRILLESTSRDTHDEAVLIAPILRSLNVERLVLVTSDVHMRRSVGAFRAQGWNVIPAIAPDPYLGDSLGDWIVPGEHGLALTGSVVHEAVGIAYYWVRGWWRA